MSGGALVCVGVRVRAYVNANGAVSVWVAHVRIQATSDSETSADDVRRAPMGVVDVVRRLGSCGYGCACGG